ncbi:MAG: alanine--tRNA ligase [Alphaproteobacteria bacterium]
MKTVNDIRSEFLGFFEKNGHSIVSSSSLVPQNDPTLMFTNAGMNQFKDVFTGKEKRPYNRATTSQKCVRAGGKHNDLENVGYTARHHTFFEMLGNFSFGDYFKEEAIAFAWELVTKNFGLSAEKLCVTVHSTDEEAAEIWKKITGFADHKIIRIATDDNFWRMGDTGPCGPCTEIFYDHGEHIWGGPPGSPEEDGDRFIEIWNNVFMQYEQIDAETRVDLPAQSVDTGMGLERIAATLMGSNNNYDIDIMRALIEHSADLTSVEADGDMAASHKVIADHLRSAAFLLADGVMPSNEGRGYVLRRIMRRGMRHAHLLGAKDPMMHKLYPTLLGKMGEAYPELKQAESLITQTLETEEKRFKTTLDRGLKMLDEETSKVNDGAKFPGDVAFKLYDTYGFPLDLTQDALRAKEIDVDTDAFDTCMAEQKAKARAAWSGAGGEVNEKIWFDILDEVGPTEFLGYEVDKAEAQIVALVKDGKRVNVLNEGDEGMIITNQSPFYAESGGQVGDKGGISGVLNPSQANVIDTKKQIASLWAHVVNVEGGSFKVGDAIALCVDTNRRTTIQSNHSATHLLHEALRQVLGDHVAQKGSLQDEERTRFDISHPNGMSAEEISKVEKIVNDEIRANTDVVTRVMALDDARESGAMALFGEKYDDEVRVVTMGTQGEGENKQFSVELCGGTHVKRTGDIGLLKIVSEGALSSGIRRVEAVTGANALSYLNTQDNTLQGTAALLKTSVNDVEQRVKSLMDEKKKLEKEVADLRKAVALGGGAGGSANDDIKEINGVKFTGRVLDGFPAKDLKPMADDLKAQLGSGVIVLVATNDGKASIVVGVTDDLTPDISAVDLVRVGSEALGGKGGGGRPDMAQAGGPNANDAQSAVDAIEGKLVG